MPITSSVIADDAAQNDGRRRIVEVHIDDAGKVYRYIYLVATGANTAPILSGHATQIAADLADRETAMNLQRAYDQLSPTFLWSTVANLRQALRQAFANASQWDAVRLGKFIAGLNLTDAQLTTLFGVSGAQLTALKNKLSALASKYDDILAQQGQ